MIRHKERIRRTDKKTDTKTHKDRKLPPFTHLPFLTVAVKQNGPQLSYLRFQISYKILVTQLPLRESQDCRGLSCQLQKTQRHQVRKPQCKFHL